MSDVPQSSGPLHLSLALESTGWHPASWREPGARADELATARFWADAVTEAERGFLDLVTFADAFGLQGSHFGPPEDRTEAVADRVDTVVPLLQECGSLRTEHTGSTLRENLGLSPARTAPSVAREGRPVV